MHVSVSVLYKCIPIRPTEVPLSPERVKKGQNSANLIFPEPLVVEGWLTPQNDRKLQLSVSAFHNVYPDDHRKHPFLTKEDKKGQISLI